MEDFLPGIIACVLFITAVLVWRCVLRPYLHHGPSGPSGKTILPDPKTVQVSITSIHDKDPDNACARDAECHGSRIGSNISEEAETRNPDFCHDKSVHQENATTVLKMDASVERQVHCMISSESTKSGGDAPTMPSLSEGDAVLKITATQKHTVEKESPKAVALQQDSNIDLVQGRNSDIVLIQDQVTATCKELERCRTLSCLQQVHIAHIQEMAKHLVLLEGRLAELCQDFIRLVELTALARAYNKRLSCRSTDGSMSDTETCTYRTAGIDPMIATELAAESCRTLARAVQPEEDAICSAVVLAVNETVEPMLASKDRRKKLKSKVSSFKSKTGFDRIPKTTGEAQLLLAEALENAAEVSTKTKSAESKVIRDAAKVMCCTLGPAQKAAVALLVTRMHEIRSMLNSRAVELVQSESALSVTSAMIKVLTRRQTAAVDDILDFYKGGPNITSLKYPSKTQKSQTQEVLELAKLHTSKPDRNIIMSSQLVKPRNKDGSGNNQENFEESKTLITLRKALERSWVDVTAAQTAYASNLELGYLKNAALVKIDDTVSHEQDFLSSPPNHTVANQEFCDQDSGHIAPLSIECGVEPVVLPDESPAVGCKLIQEPRKRHQEVRQQAVSDITPTEKALSSSSADHKHIQEPQTRHHEIKQQTISDSAQAKKSSSSYASDHEHIQEPHKGHHEIKEQSISYSALAKKSASSSPATHSSKLQWKSLEFLERMIHGRDLLMLQGGTINAAWTGLRRSTTPCCSKSHGFLNSVSDVIGSRKMNLESIIIGQATSVSLSRDYSRLVLRRHGCSLSTFVRIADILSISNKGKRQVVSGPHKLQPSPDQNNEKGDGFLKDKLFTFSIYMSERTISFGCQSKSEHKAWIEGLQILLFHKNKLKHLKASMVPFAAISTPNSQTAT